VDKAKVMGKTRTMDRVKIVGMVKGKERETVSNYLGHESNTFTVIFSG
jgi:hypothetical protein